MGTGLIYAAIVAAWIAYLVPVWVRRREQRATVQPAEASQDRGRLLVRRPAPGTAAHPVSWGVAAESGAAGDDGGPPATGAPSAMEYDVGAVDATPAPDPWLVRARRARAAGRRRRVLTVLVIVALGLTGATLQGLLPAVAPAVPAALLVLFLFVSRRSVARARAADRRAADRAVPARIEAEPEVAAAAEPAEAVEEPLGPIDLVLPPLAPTAPPSGGPATGRRVTTPPPAVAGSLWDPIPVTLPTYVTAAPASRTVRTVELSDPGFWSSGRLLDARSVLFPERDRSTDTPPSAELSAPASDVDGEGGTPAVERRRAVGD